jgi:hypothetical protein
MRLRKVKSLHAGGGTSFLSPPIENENTTLPAQNSATKIGYICLGIFQQAMLILIFNYQESVASRMVIM